MNEKKQKILKDLELFEISSLKEQAAAYVSTLEKAEDGDYLLIDKVCTLIVKRMRYSNPKAKIEYEDGLEVLAKLGLFVSLNGKDDNHG
jgi:hypothetical protein